MPINPEEPSEPIGNSMGQKLEYQSKVWLPMYACQEVYLCLCGDEWLDQTESGNKFVLATINNTGRYLGMGGPFPTFAPDPRQVDHFQYSITIADGQIQDDPETGEPYVVACSDVCSVESVCLVDELVRLTTVIE